MADVEGQAFQSSTEKSQKEVEDDEKTNNAHNGDGNIPGDGNQDS